MKASRIVIFILILLLASLFCVQSRLEIAQAQGNITINSDGSFSPSTAPLSRTESAGRMIYTFTSDILNSAIIIQKTHITIEGDGHSLRGNSGINAGILLQSGQGVKITNLRIEGFQNGVRMQDCGSCQLIGNTIVDNTDAGIELSGASYWNNLQRNIIKGNRGDGISLNEDSEHNTIINNIIEQNQFGININDLSKDNIVGGNAFIDNARHFGDYNGQPNKWNSDYDVSKGNYWSDYAARGYLPVDERSGSNQDQPGNDGVWDNSYIIYPEAGVKDNYPLVETVEKRASTITCLPNWEKEDNNTYSIIIMGTITPKVSDALVFVTVNGPGVGGERVTRAGQTRTNTEGIYEWVVTGFDEGSVSVEVHWDGNERYYGARSTEDLRIIVMGDNWWEIIPGFPFESIAVGLLLAFGMLYAVRKKKLAALSTSLK
jgi:parallel beta-helix repeat protein